MRLVDVDRSLVIASQRPNSSQTDVLSCNFIELVTVILTFAKHNLFDGEKLDIPKFSVLKIFKWIKIAKFFIDIVQIIVGCLNKKQLRERDLSNAFVKASLLRDNEVNRLKGETLRQLNIK